MSILDLLLGMMLPSGNDSAMCIAENIGLIYKLGEVETKKRFGKYEEIFKNELQS